MNIPNKLLVAAALSVAWSSAAIAAPALTTLTVEHMNCVTCPVVVKAALSAVDGVEEVAVSMPDKTVNVKFDDAHVTAEGLAQAVNEAGFPAKVRM